MSVQLEIPEGVTQAIRLPEGRMKRELLVELALALYSQGFLSFGKARELAEMPKYEFGLLVGKRGIPRHYGPEELEEDIAYAGGEEYLPDYEFGDHWRAFPSARPIWRGPDSRSST